MHATPIIGYVRGEEPFRYMGSNGRFVLSASTSSYTLNYSGDGSVWTAIEDSTPSGENHVVVNVPTGMFFKLGGHDSDAEVVITY